MEVDSSVDIQQRLDNLRKTLREKNLDTLMVTIEENRRYLSGFTGEDTQFDESAGALFITSDRLVLATDSRYSAQARRIRSPRRSLWTTSMPWLTCAQTG